MPSCPQCGEQLGSGDPAVPEVSDPGYRWSEFPRTRRLKYRKRPLGEGGMGTVYLAEQCEPIRRRVALKVVKVGMDTAQVLARFANERQSLAIIAEK